MAQHTFKNFDPSYWTIEGSTITTKNVLSTAMSAYVIDPVSLQSAGYTKDSYDLTKENLSSFFIVFSPPGIAVSNYSNYALSAWTSRGWGSTVDEVQQNFSFFVLNNIGGSDKRLNPEGKNISSALLSGTVQGTEYFLPIIRASTDGVTYAIPQIDSGDFTSTPTTTEDSGNFTDTRVLRTFDGGTF